MYDCVYRQQNEDLYVLSTTKTVFNKGKKLMWNEMAFFPDLLELPLFRPRPTAFKLRDALRLFQLHYHLFPFGMRVMAVY